MSRIILTGSISSGKSTVVEALRSSGIVIVDSDEISRNIFTRNIPHIQKMFASELKGQELRRFVGNTIFSNPQKKMQLEAFMHPKIRKVIQTREAKLKSVKHIIDMPLYFETKHFLNDDYVILLSIPYETQLSRLMERDDLSEDQANNRIMSQIPTAIKERKSDYIITNDGTLDELKEKTIEMMSIVYHIKKD